MKTYCVKYRKDTENIEQKMVREKKRLVMQLKCSVCGIKKSRFVKECLIFWKIVKCFTLSVNMNEIVTKFLLLGDKYMPELHLKQSDFTYSACGPFTKKKKELQTGHTNFIYENELNKPCFQHDMAYGESKI